MTGSGLEVVGSAFGVGLYRVPRVERSLDCEERIEFHLFGFGV